MIKPSATFIEALLQSNGDRARLYNTPIPESAYEHETGFLHLNDNQDKFFAELEMWLNENQEFIRKYIHFKNLQTIQQKDNIIPFK